MDIISKKNIQTDTGIDLVEVQERKKVRYNLETITKQIENLEKSIAKFQTRKTQLENIYNELTK